METEKIFKRKKELIKRDPIWGELDDVFHKVIKSRGSNALATSGCMLREVERDLCSHLKPGEDFFAKYQETYPDHWKLRNLSGDISAKWHVFLKFDPEDGILILPCTYDEAIFVGNPSRDHYPKLEWTPYPNSLRKELILEDINYFFTLSYNGIRERYIPLVINIDRINKNDAKKVKRLLWKIIESNLQKGKTKKPLGEYPECAFLYHIRKEDTFQRYLKWYDLHTKEKLGFRLIAFIDNTSKTDPQRASKLLEKLKSEKYRCGEPKEGEDKIEKGVKLIYKAIHRDNYSRKTIEPLFEEYNCSTHGKNCPASCRYYKGWVGRFNRLMPTS